MIILAKSEPSFSKCPTKKYITPPPEKNVNPLEKRNLNHSPTPLYIPITTLRMFFFPSNFPYLKKTGNAQLCTGKIRAIHGNNIENRP